jgi:hypothetical protein
MEPFEIKYKLTRAQRLVPLLRAWGFVGPLILAGVVVCLIQTFTSAWWVVFLALGGLWVVKGLIIGLINIAIYPVVDMDIRVEENVLGFMGKTERLWVFLDGVTRVYQPRSDIWTVWHHNGTLITIPSDKITPEQIEYIRSGPKRMEEKRKAQQRGA